MKKKPTNSEKKSPVTKRPLTALQKLCKKYGITEQIGYGIGFNPIKKKWYGWSHRAIYGFGVGSKIEKGDTCYNPKKGEWTAKTLDDAKKMAIAFSKSVS